MDEAFAKVSDFLRSDVYKEAIEDLEDEIRDISISIDWVTWVKVKKAIRRSKERGENEIEEKFGELVKQVLPSGSSFNDMPFGTTQQH